jgi:peptidoglycan/xylan/chitin deacetylase (PgdA/CDA1 family)
MMDRRLFMAGLVALGACRDELGSTNQKDAHQKRMAITMDDFNLEFDIGLSQRVRHENILDAFDAVKHKAAGFITGSFVDKDWGQQVYKDWVKKGHLIGNHTWAHPHANETSVEDYISNIRNNHRFLLSSHGTSDFFRFPFLDDGRDRAQQVALFEALQELELRNAPVTMDSVDWYTSSRLEAALKTNPNVDLAPYRDYYVTMCVTLSNHWDQVAQALGYKSLPHLTLMHHNILNGHFLKDVLLALKADGWRFVDAVQALEFDEYHPIPNAPTHGRNWLTLKALERGIEIPPYPKQYLAFGRKEMDALGL